MLIKIIFTNFQSQKRNKKIKPTQVNRNTSKTQISELGNIISRETPKHIVDACPPRNSNPEFMVCF